MSATTTAAVDGTLAPGELLRHLFEKILNQRSADVLVEYWADDIVEHFPSGTCRGRDEVRDYFAQLFAAVPDFEIHAEKIVGEGETVFVRWRATGTFTGAPWMGIEPTGSSLELRGIDCFTVRGGKVAENFVVFDQLSFARQIGMMPAEGSFMDRMMLNGFNARTRLRGRFGKRGGSGVP